jgi:class 3 adenylate cyclase
MRPLEGAERKLATMVFADLVGSTELASGLDPEVLRGRLEPFFDVARGSLEEHGGTLEKYIGDAVMAVFGVPRAHGDDPDRAVAAALALVDRMAELDPDLALRIGVETGEVLATDPTGDLSVTGEPVNAAVRLQQAAEPGEVLVGERAARACRRVRLERRGPVTAKGLPDSLIAWRAVAVGGEAELSELPFLGRDDDLELLRIVYRRAVRERAPQLVTVTGEAGIGKTRLAAELVSELRSASESPRVLVGRNPAYGRGIAFWALGEILREVGGAEADEPVSEVRARLEAVLSELGADDADRVASALTIALGGANGAGDGDAEDELKRAWRRLVALLAADRPLVIGVDDAHWADDGLLELLEDIAFGLQDAPLLVLCTTRPELYERKPDFGRSARNVSQIELRPLDPTAATELVELLLPDEAREIAPRVAEASGGNPFFAEEVARSITDRAAPAAVHHLPDTVQAAISARIDLLPPEEKRVLQHAAILGVGFRDVALTQLMEDPAHDALAALERRALVQERLAAGPGRYSFRHHLIRDVAYGTLPRRDRAGLHERAAAGIRARAGERQLELAELIAFHLARAAELDHNAERRTAAFEATRSAADATQRRGIASRAQELLEHAAELAPDDDERFQLLWRAAEVALRRWRGDQALRLLRDAAEVAERAGNEPGAATAYGRAVEVAARMGGITGKFPLEEMRELLARGHQLAPDDDVAIRAQLLLDEAWIAWRFDDAGGMAGPATVALELARQGDDVRLISSAYDAIHASSWIANRFDEALGHGRERLAFLRRAPATPALEIEFNDALHMVIETLLQTGGFREAARFALEARELDLSRGVVYSGWARGLLPAFFLGEWNEALRMATRVREAWVAEERPPLAVLGSAIGAAAAIWGFRGDDASATDWFEFADSMVGAGGPTASGQAGAVLMFHADVDLHHGRPEAAAGWVEEPFGGFWWNVPYLATRAEAFIAAGREDAGAALTDAEAVAAEHPYARAIVLRARGTGSGDEQALRQALAIFREIECPYQQARTGWLLGGAERAEAEAVFARLRTSPPTA